MQRNSRSKMVIKKPTKQQEAIINEQGNCVVIADPGSGKTYTISTKIRQILADLPPFKGVIAISFTNKASDELKFRCIGDGLERKNSFFGTIDKFFISEIIIPFGKQVFGYPNKEIEIINVKGLPKTFFDEYNKLDEVLNYSQITNNHIDFFKRAFISGYILLNSIGYLAIFIFDNSVSCHKYMKARFCHVFIDEYQDSGVEQHYLFLRLQSLGITAIAVGDAKQAIYGFTNKQPEHLLSLNENQNFVPFRLTKNHRCHQSIIDYSTILIFPKYKPKTKSEIRIFEKSINGDEAQIGNWLNSAIPYYKQKYNVLNNNQIAILTRGERSENLISSALQIPYKKFIKNALEEDFTPCSTMFCNILNLLCSKIKTKYEFLDENVDLVSDLRTANLISKKIDFLKAAFLNNVLLDYLNVFQEIGEIILPDEDIESSLKILENVIEADSNLSNFKPASLNEIQIMTLHKSKGLEFDIVFHMDLHEWVFPIKTINNGKTELSDLEQDINLHFVGITRAKECTILCTSTKRHNRDLLLKNGNKSEFLLHKPLFDYRENSEI
ncbi:MAG: ATP-dependent helicase [Limnohabitans sp.]|nr:ATP-dependent helicase [Limnohabitans sp.]